jgi:hypothetical protein
MAYFEPIDLETPGTYKPPPMPSVGGAPSGVSSYNAPPLSPGTFTGFAPGEVVRNTPQQTPQTPSPFNYNDFYSFANNLGGQYSGSLQDFQTHIVPQLAAQFPGIQQFGSKGDKIRLPNGQSIDAVISAGLGGTGYNWGIEQPHGLAGYFSDPALQQFLNFGSGAMDQLMQPQAINPTLQSAIDSLMRSISADAGFGEFAAIARPRLEQLKNPAYSDRERDIIRTNFSDPLERQRTSRMEAEKLRLSSRGITPESGIFNEAMLGVNRDFDQARTIGDRELAVREIGLEDERAKEAIAIGQILASLAGSDRAGDISAAGSLAGIGGHLQDAPIRNLLSAAGISQNMAQLPFQSLSAAQSAHNTMNPTIPQSDMGGIISLLMSLAGQGENANNANSAQNAALWQSIINGLPGILDAFKPPPTDEDEGR